MWDDMLASIGFGFSIVIIMFVTQTAQSKGPPLAHSVAIGSWNHARKPGLSQFSGIAFTYRQV